jgi:uncharacterized membrane protein
MNVIKVMDWRQARDALYLCAAFQLMLLCTIAKCSLWILTLGLAVGRVTTDINSHIYIAQHSHQFYSALSALLYGRTLSVSVTILIMILLWNIIWLASCSQWNNEHNKKRKRKIPVRMYITLVTFQSKLKSMEIGM